MKPIVMKEAVQFIKEQAEAITKVLTRAHQRLNKEFIDYKLRNDELIEQRNFIHSKWLSAERALAMKAPVREAEYALDEDCALRLYDCLIPLIRENRRFLTRKDKLFSTCDYQAQQKVLQLRLDLSRDKMPGLRDENCQLKLKVAQLEEELSVVKWYMETMEDGIDTKEIVREYAKLKKEFKRMKE